MWKITFSFYPWWCYHMALAFAPILFTLLLFIYFNHYSWLVKRRGALTVYSWLYSPSQYGPGSSHAPYLQRRPFLMERSIIHLLNETLRNDSALYWKRVSIICGFFFLPTFPNHLYLLIYGQDIFQFQMCLELTKRNIWISMKGERLICKLFNAPRPQWDQIEEHFFMSWVQMN